MASPVVDRQVIQRTSEDSAAFEASGAVTFTDVAGAVVAKSDGPGQIALPVGGPYVVTGDGVVGGRASHVLVGDLWVLAGQSNMQGVGRLDHGLTESAEPLVGLLDMAHRWREPTEPLHVLSQSPDVCHSGATPEEREGMANWDAMFAHVGASLGVPFANAVVRSTGVPVGLVATAHGGTSLDQWSPERVGEEGGSLHWSMLSSIAAAGGKVAGVLWYQGESDCVPGLDVTYNERFGRWVADVRDRLGDDQLPVYVVQLGRLVAESTDADPNWETWNSVRRAQLGWRETGVSGMATAIDLPLDDAIHISTAGLTRLGRRLAALATGTAATPEPVSVELVEDKGLRVNLRLAGGTGSLSPDFRMRGFSVLDGETPRALVFDARRDPSDQNVIRLALTRLPVAGEVLWYGHGADPACDVVDEADMALPVFSVPLPTSIGETIAVDVPGR